MSYVMDKWVRSWRWIVVGVVALFVGLALVVPLIYAVAGFPRPPYPWFPLAGFWAFFLIFFLFFGLRWLLWPWGWGRHPGSWHRDESRSVLRERYARGEITKEEFEGMLRNLERVG